MKKRRLRINIMTAGLTAGDAISNYIFSKARLLRELGATVVVYADHVDPRLAARARHSSLYRSTGEAILWYHFSIYSENVELAMRSEDYKILDYHGICPPRLFAGQNEHLRFLCQSGIDLLPEFVTHFRQFVVHSEYTREQLLDLGCDSSRVHKIFICVDTSHFQGVGDAQLSAGLEKLNYLLFVGRVVPQKDILASLRIFAEVNRQRPDMVYIMVGSRRQTPRYQQEIDRFIGERGLQERIIFTGQVDNPSVLAALYENATFYLATSEWESFCVPLAESLFFGLPPMVHSVPPLPEVSGPAGVVIDKQDPVAAAQQIVAVLDDDEAYRALRQVAPQWAEQYTDEALSQNLQRFLAQIALDLRTTRGAGKQDFARTAA